MPERSLNWRELADLGFKKGVVVIDVRPGSPRRQLGTILDVIDSRNIQVRWRNKEGDFREYSKVGTDDIEIYREFMRKRQRG